MMNDISVLGGITIFFIIVGATLPFLNASFGGAETYYNITSATGNITNSTKNMESTDIEPTWLNPLASLNAISVLFSILKMFFWSFSVNIWIELLIFEPLRIIAYAIIARNIWIGGGG